MPEIHNNAADVTMFLLYQPQFSHVQQDDQLNAEEIPRRAKLAARSVSNQYPAAVGVKNEGAKQGQEIASGFEIDSA
jgi:hypothetical protein